MMNNMKMRQEMKGYALRCSSLWMSKIGLLKVILFLLIILTMISTHCSARPKRSRSADNHQALPECVDETSFCGYVQLNAMGVSVQQSCRCRNQVFCPLVWDPFDGRTIIHGNDQYKYCAAAPRLAECRNEDIAYSTYMEMSLISMETLVNSNHLHCQCRANHIFLRNATKFHEMDSGVSVIATSYNCNQPPRCGPKDVCMAITESASSSFVTRKCGCPLGTFCPNDIRLASERVDLDRGAYYVMQCI